MLSLAGFANARGADTAIEITADASVVIYDDFATGRFENLAKSSTVRTVGKPGYVEIIEHPKNSPPARRSRTAAVLVWTA